MPTSEQFEKKIESTGTEQIIDNGINRREFFTRAAAIAAVLAAGCAKKEERIPEYKINPLSMPRVEVTNEKPALNKPEGIECSDAEYLEVCKKFANEILESTKKLMSELAKPNVIRDELITKSVMEAYKAAQKYPEFKAYLSKNPLQDTRDLTAITKIIQPLLIDGGCFYDAIPILLKRLGKNVLVPIPQVTMGPIREKKLVKFDDEKGELEIPVLFVDSSYLSTEDNTPLTSFNYNAKSAVIIEDQKRQALADRLWEMSKEGLVPQGLDFEKMLEECLRGSVIHEAVHGYLAERYPKYDAGDKRLLINGNLIHEPNKEMHTSLRTCLSTLGNERHPIQFHELAAVGYELSNNKEHFPVSYIDYMGPVYERDFVLPYFLVERLVKLLSVKHANEDLNIKGQILKKLESGQRISNSEFVKLAKTLTPDQIEAVGEEMFYLGTFMLFVAENGKFEEHRYPIRRY